MKINREDAVADPWRSIVATGLEQFVRNFFSQFVLSFGS